MNADIRKIVAAIIAAPMIATDKVGEIEQHVLRHGTAQEKAGIRYTHRARITKLVLSCVEVAEVLCEFIDTAPENRHGVADAWMGEPPPMQPPKEGP